MECPSCGSPEVLIEDIGGGNKRTKCPKCGFSEIRDSEGRKLLIGEVECMPRPLLS